MKKWNEDSRTYDPKELKTEEDKRFIHAKKRDDTDSCTIFYLCAG